MSYYVIKQPNGGVHVLQILDTSILTEEEILERDIPAGAEYRKVTVDQLPSNRAFREAWTDDNPTNTVDICPIMAKAIHMKRLREMRNLKLDELDRDTMKYLSDSEKLQEVDAIKQTLRDLPQTFDMSNLDLNKPYRCWPNDLELPVVYKKL